MKSWYMAVCDQHKEFIRFFVSNPSCSAHYFNQEDDVFIQGWLTEHYSCNLRMIHRDDQLDELHEKGYEKRR